MPLTYRQYFEQMQGALEEQFEKANSGEELAHAKGYHWCLTNILCVMPDALLEQKSLLTKKSIKNHPIFAKERRK